MGFNSVVKISELQCVVETPAGKSLYTAYDNVCRYWEIGAEGVGACYCKRTPLTPKDSARSTMLYLAAKAVTGNAIMSNSVETTDPEMQKYVQERYDKHKTFDFFGIAADVGITKISDSMYECKMCSLTLLVVAEALHLKVFQCTQDGLLSVANFKTHGDTDGELVKLLTRFLDEDNSTCDEIISRIGRKEYRNMEQGLTNKYWKQYFAWSSGDAIGFKWKMHVSGIPMRYKVLADTAKSIHMKCDSPLYQDTVNTVIDKSSPDTGSLFFDTEEACKRSIGDSGIRYYYNKDTNTVTEFKVVSEDATTVQLKNSIDGFISIIQKSDPRSVEGWYWNREAITPLGSKWRMHVTGFPVEYAVLSDTTDRTVLRSISVLDKSETTVTIDKICPETGSMFFNSREDCLASIGNSNVRYHYDEELKRVVEYRITAEDNATMTLTSADGSETKVIDKSNLETAYGWYWSIDACTP